MNFKARMKQRALKQLRRQSQLIGSLLSAYVPEAGNFANAGQCVSSEHLFDKKYAEAQKWIDSKELEFLSSQASIMIANALNSIALPEKKSWLKRILGI